MELKPIDDGYKKTVAGVIPNDWSVRHMGEVARVVSGQVDPTIKPYSLMPLVAPDHIESGSGRLASSIPTAEEQRAISGKYLFRSGTVIYSKIRPHLRKVCIAPFDGVCSADMYPLLPADDVHPGFLFASLLSERFSKYAESVSIRSGMPKINRQELADFEFVLPSTRYEQAQIALTLTDADALIDSLEQLLTKKRHIKQGAMQELLTGKRRLPGFGGEWVTCELRQLGQVVRGVAYNPGADLAEGDTEQTVRLLRSNNVQSGEIVRSGLQFVDRRRVRNDQYLQDGDLLLCMANGSRDLVGKTGRFVQTDEHLYTFGAFMACYRPDPASVAPEFVAFIFQTHDFRQHIDLLLAGSSINNLRPEGVLGFTTCVPTEHSEQVAIAQVLSDMDTEIASLESRLTKARALKQAMAQALLTGRIRLVEPSA